MWEKNLVSIKKNYGLHAAAWCCPYPTGHAYFQHIILRLHACLSSYFHEKSHSTCRSVKCVEINKQSKMSFETSASRLPANLGCTITWHNTDASVVSNQFCICTVVISYIFCLSLEYVILCHGTRNLFTGLKGLVSLLWILPGKDCTHLLSALYRKLLCLSARHTRLKGVANSIILFLYFLAFISSNKIQHLCCFFFLSWILNSFFW